jgi:hypothetical protein
MAHVMPERVERQLQGIRNMVIHAEHLARQGIISHAELEHARTYALEQRFGPLMDVETYKAARESGDFEKYEALMNDERSGTPEQRELAARKIAAHKITDTALENLTGADPAELRVYRTEMEKMVGKSDQADDFEALIDYAGKVELSYGKDLGKPAQPVPDWLVGKDKIDPDSDHARDFKLRFENTRGSKEWHDSRDAAGNKRDSKGRYIPEKMLREDADKIPQRTKTLTDDLQAEREAGWERGDGHTIDKRYGIMSEAEAREIEAFENSRSTPPPAPEQPVTLPNPHSSEPAASEPSASPAAEGPVNF